MPLKLGTALPVGFDTLNDHAMGEACPSKTSVDVVPVGVDALNDQAMRLAMPVKCGGTVEPVAFEALNDQLTGSALPLEAAGIVIAKIKRSSTAMPCNSVSRAAGMLNRTKLPPEASTAPSTVNDCTPSTVCTCIVDSSPSPSEK